MKFSTKSLQKIEEILTAEISKALESGDLHSSEIEEGLREILQEAGKNSYGNLLTLLDKQRNGVEATCACGETMKRVSKREAQVLSVFGWAKYQRSYYKCGSCGHHFVALDESEGLRAGRATPQMSSLLGLAGVTVSFEEARHQIKAYLQVDVSANTIRQETQWMGKKQATLEEAWIAQSKDLDYLQERERTPKRPKRMYGSIDGAFVPLEKEWKEAKTVTWYQVGTRYGRKEPHATNIAYYTSLEQAESFGELLWGTAVQHHADQAEELIFINDGAHWIWNLVDRLFPQAVQIVDWYHASEYLHAVADVLPAEETERRRWLEAMQPLLWEGEIEPIISECEGLLPQAGEPARRLISYYGNNIKRMRYADFRAKDYMIGSGTVESACKQIIAMRLKRSGARWTEYGAEMTAKARTAWLNRSWDSLAHLPLAT